MPRTQTGTKTGTKTGTTHRQRLLVAAAAALAGIAAGALVSQDASAGRLLTGRQIADGTVSGKDLRDGTVTTRDVKDGSLGPADHVPPRDVARGEPRGLLAGPDGVTGPEGGAGPVGPVGMPGIAGVFATHVSVDVGGNKYAVVTTTCPGDTKVLAGGVHVKGRAHEVSLNSSAPLDDGAGWATQVYNGAGLVATVTGFAVCATAS